MDELLREKMKHPWSLRVSITISLYFSSNYTTERCFRSMYEGEDTERILSSSLTAHHYSLLIAICEICVKVKQFSTVQACLVTSDANQLVIILHKYTQPQSNTIARVASSWTR